MKFGVVLPQFGKFASAESMRRMAQAAEDLGWDSVWFADHLVIPTPYRSRFSDTFYELFASMGYIAAYTSRVRIGTSIVILPYRHPVMTAKQVATLDHLSHGRIILGVAFGWMPEEYELLGIPFEKRGRRSDECLRAMKQCWSSDEPRFEGEFYKCSGFAFSPRPIQQPHPPIWIGGNDHRSLRRVVEVGDGWHPISGPRIGLSMKEFESRLQALRALADEKGRDPNAITISFHAPLSFDADPASVGEFLSFIGSPDEVTRRVKQCETMGVSHLVLNCFYGMPAKMESSTVDPFIRTMEEFTERVRPRL